MLWLSILSFIFFRPSVAAEPSVLSTDFPGIPLNLRYFDDSQTVLALIVPDSGIETIGTIYRSTDAGASWEPISGPKENGAVDFWMHPYDKQRAYALGPENIHWVTKDQGKNWKQFDIGEDYSISRLEAPFSFHGTDPDKVIMNTKICSTPLQIFCSERAHYTTDGFNDVVERIGLPKPRGCIFVHATPLKKDKGDHENRILCIDMDDDESSGSSIEDQRLVYSDDFFKTKPKEPKMDKENKRTVPGIISMADVKGFIVAAQRSKNTKQLNLYVSVDGENWDLAQFPHNHKLEEKGYTMLESTNYSIQVNVMTDYGGSSRRDDLSMGTLFSSDSDGVFFTENIADVNRNPYGYVDFEKVEGIQGIYLINVVGNQKEVRGRQAEKKLQSKITFDDGRTFHPLTVVDAEGKKTDEELHVHSITDPSNIGRTFSAAAPGIVMAIGNTGSFLRGYREGDFYVSDDAGLTWRRALKDAHKYEVGDQGSIIVAIYDEGETNELKYNTQHGRGNWETVGLEEEVVPEALTTVPDSTSLKFILVASFKNDKSKYRIFSIDFEGVREKCKDDDFETWTARKDEKGEPDCLMGHKQSYRRRKSDADCFVLQEYEDPKPVQSNCECTEEDFECAHGFKKDEDEACVPDKNFIPPEGACENEDETEFTGPSGYRKIPGNTCEAGAELDKHGRTWSCDLVKAPPSQGSGDIVVTAFEFKSTKKFRQKVYLEKAPSGNGKDTVFVLTDSRDVLKSTDNGKTWDEMKFGEGDVKIESMWPHPYNVDRIFFLTNGKKVYFSLNKGESVGDFTAPSDPHPDFPTLSFHEENEPWLIWTGVQKGEPATSYSHDDGQLWEPLLPNSGRCEFIKAAGRGNMKHLIYCEKIVSHDRRELVSSNDYFQEDVTTHFEDLVAFATMSEYILVASKGEDSSLRLDTSVDAQTFAEAKFPRNFAVHHQTSYTVLDSSTNAIFIVVTESNKKDFDYGRIMKSNSNGTSYVLSVAGVNQNEYDFVDFEKMQGIEGVAMVNIVSNLQDEDEGKEKKLKTMITHNDGAEWSDMRYVVDDKGDIYPNCGTMNRPTCALHIHGYTEREDPSDTYSSPSAVGVMLANGNVGDHLRPDDEAETFITTDAGLKWKRVKTGKHMWEYGDQGGIIVVAKDGANTNNISYTTDLGETWTDFSFTDDSVEVMDLTTVPSDSTPNFIIWGRTDQGKLFTYSLDFSGFWDRLCDEPDEDEGENEGANKDEGEGDYYLFTPKHPTSGPEHCLFGHVRSYHRKKPDRKCWNGRQVAKRHKAADKNCQCTRSDYECDYNYELANDGTCAHVEGTELIDPKQQCIDDPQLKTYFLSKGYRRIPISTCDEPGGVSKYVGEEHPCPNYEDEYQRSHRGLSGFPFFLVAIVLPISAAAAIGYWVWRTWDGKFGRIRLGDGTSALDADQPWIKWPVAAISGLIAVLAAVPLLVGAGWRSLRNMFGGSRRYTTRDSFARGRGRYAVIDPDEDELLGGVDDDEL